VHRSAAALDALGLGLEALSGTLPALLGNPEEGGPLVRPWLFSAPRSSINGTISSRRSYASTSVTLDDVELVRRVFGTTLNDVVLAAVGGAVRRLLESRSDLPDRSLVALVPVSTRRRSDKGALGNRLSGMLVALRTDKGEAGARLSAIAEVTRAARTRHLVTRGRMLDDVVELSPAFAVSRAVRWADGIGLFDHLSPPFNLVVSYVSGPSVPLWCAGGRVVGVLPAGPVAAGVGLNITVFSYLGRLWFGLLGCRRLLPEVQDLAIMVDDALTELVTASGVVRPAPAVG
jgi:WS/DGAT/MGAT family acyltransferase